jgi:hypothetical protein
MISGVALPVEPLIENRMRAEWNERAQDDEEFLATASAPSSELAGSQNRIRPRESFDCTAVEEIETSAPIP